MYDTNTQLLYLAVFLAKHDLYTKMKKVHKPAFYNATIRKAVEFIDEYYDLYSSLPDHLLIKTKTTVDVPSLPSVDFSAEQWFEKEYPKFCLHKSLELAIMEANEEISKENYDVVEKLIQDAFEVRLGFDYGLVYDEDPKGRLENILKRSGNISSGFESIDKKLGKFNAGDLVIYVGGSGCVTGETIVTIKKIPNPNIQFPEPFAIPVYGDFDDLCAHLVNYYTADELSAMCKANGNNQFNVDYLLSMVQPTKVQINSLHKNTINPNYSYVVHSPDGWVPVADCIEKIKTSMYKLTLSNNVTINVSHDHGFQQSDGEWLYAENVQLGTQLISDSGIVSVTTIEQYNAETKVYDLAVSHHNHRYYTNGISSHNTGKSLFLQNHAVNYWKEGKNVLQITLELHPELVARRMDSMLLNVSTKDLYSSLDDVALNVALERKKRAFQGDLRIKYLPSGSSTAEIKNLVKMYMNDTGRKVDILIVDYLDLVHPAGKFSTGDTFSKDKLVTEELRNIGQEFGSVILTASQLNRQSLASIKEHEELDHSHIAGGISKINTADLVLGIICTDAMREKGQYLLQALKVRNGQGTGLKIPLIINSSSMRIQDCPDFLSTINSNSNISTQQSNEQLKTTHVNKLMNEIQQSLNTPNNEQLSGEQNVDDDNDQLSSIHKLINRNNKGT